MLKPCAEYKKDLRFFLRATEGRVETDHRAPVSEKVGNLKFHFLAGDFFQNNPFILDSFTNMPLSRRKVRIKIPSRCLLWFWSIWPELGEEL